MPFELFDVGNKTEEAVESGKRLDRLFYYKFLTLIVLTCLHSYIGCSRKKVLLTYTPFFSPLLKLHLLFLSLQCSLVLFSLQFRPTSPFTTRLFQMLSFGCMMLSLICNLGSAFLCATFVNSVTMVFSWNGRRRRMRYLVGTGIVVYTAWTSPCNWLDPTTTHVVTTDNETFSIIPLNLLTVFLTSSLLSARVFTILRSRTPLCFLDACRLIQLISVTAVIEIFMIIHCFIAMISGFRYTRECSYNSFADFELSAIHLMYVASAIFIDHWHLMSRRVGPEEETGSVNEVSV